MRLPRVFRAFRISPPDLHCTSSRNVEELVHFGAFAQASSCLSNFFKSVPDVLKLRKTLFAVRFFVRLMSVSVVNPAQKNRAF